MLNGLVRLARWCLNLACEYHMRFPLISALACQVAFIITPSVYALLEMETPAKRRLVVEIDERCALAVFAHQSLRVDFSHAFTLKMMHDQNYAMLHKQSFHANHRRALFLLPGFLSGLFSPPPPEKSRLLALLIAQTIEQLTLDSTNCSEMFSSSPLAVDWFLWVFDQDNDDDVKWHSLRALGNMALHERPSKIILQILHVLLQESNNNPQTKNHNRRAALWALGNLQHTHAVEFQPHWEDENFNCCEKSLEFENKVRHRWQVKRNMFLVLQILPNDLVRGELVNMLY